MQFWCTKIQIFVLTNKLRDDDVSNKFIFFCFMSVPLHMCRFVKHDAWIPKTNSSVHALIQSALAAYVQVIFFLFFHNLTVYQQSVSCRQIVFLSIAFSIFFTHVSSFAFISASCVIQFFFLFFFRRAYLNLHIISHKD